MGTKASIRFIELCAFVVPFLFFFFLILFPIIKFLKMKIIGVICVLASALTTLGAPLEADDVELRDVLQEFVRAAEDVNTEDLRDDDDGSDHYPLFRWGVSRLLQMDDSAVEKLREAFGWGDVKKGWNNVKNSMKKGWSKVKDTAKNVGDNMKNAAFKALDGLSAVGGKVIDAVKGDGKVE